MAQTSTSVSDAPAAVVDDTTADKNYALPGGKSEADFMVEMRERYREAEAFWGPQYRRAMDMMRFTFFPDEQWDEWMKMQRRGRPMYTFNKVRQAVKQVTNDQRQNRPQPKVRGANEAGMKRAELREGIYRGIERLSRADRAYDTAFQFSVGGGFGLWRVTTGYVDDRSFDQDIQIKECRNPYAGLFDPSAKEKDRRDGQFFFYKDTVSRSSFKHRWPNATLSDFDGQAWASEWSNNNEITICEYWYKVRAKKTILKMSDGAVVDLESVSAILDELSSERGITEVGRREVEVDEVWQCIVSGAHILEKPKKWAGKFIPFVPVWGEIVNIDGKDHFFGMTDYAKDAQRLYNYERSTFVEVLADQPKSPLMATPAMIEGYEEDYENLRTQTKPVLLYNVDPDAPNGGRPTREAPPAFPVALANAAQISNDDIKATTGKYDASLGARSNETSGRAILARAREGDVSSFDFIDNLAYAQQFCYEIVDDLIPTVYDTARQITIIGPDEKEKVIEVNQPVFDQQSGQWIEVNDFEDGRFSIGVTTGPSFTTQRLETADAMMNLSNDPSPIGMLAKYQFLMSMDTPGMDDIRKAARRVMVAQGLIEPDPNDPGAAPPAPPPPNPKDVADAEEKHSQARLNDAKRAEIEQGLERQVAVDQVQMGHLAAPPQMQPGDLNAPAMIPMGGQSGRPVAIPPEMSQDSPVSPAPDGFPG